MKFFDNLIGFFGTIAVIIMVIIYGGGFLAAIGLFIWEMFDLSSNWWIILLWFVACSICGILSAEWEKKRSK